MCRSIYKKNHHASSDQEKKFMSGMQMKVISKYQIVFEY